MTSIELLIANALVPADFVPDLLRDMALPALDILAAQGMAREIKAQHGDLLPGWQAWPVRDLTAVNVALGWSRAFNVALEEGARRYLLQPVHFDIGQQGLVLDDPSRLAISSQEHEALMAALKPVMEPLGIRIAGGNANHWLVDLPADLEVRAPVAELALHEEVLPWMPLGAGARAWRRISTEIEMVLHALDLNDVRLQSGLVPISTLWLSGDGSVGPLSPLPYQSVSDLPAWLGAWPLDGHSSNHLEGVTQLSVPYFSEDWSGFRNTLIGIDQRLMRHLNALRSGEIGRLSVVFSGGSWLREVSLRRADLYKFWRRGKAFELFDLPE